MPKRLADADSRRFFEDFESVKASRMRGLDVIVPTKPHALIPMGGKDRLINVKHTTFWNGGGWSFFLCPKCRRRASKLYLIDDAPLCCKCCEAMNIRHVSKMGFGRHERRLAQDRRLDELIAKLETKERLRVKPSPARWRDHGRVYNQARLTKTLKRRMIQLRLQQLAYQDRYSDAAESDELRTMKATPAAAELLDLRPIWQANTAETLLQALDNAQNIILNALESDDPQQRLLAAKLMMRTKQARDRGLR